MIDAGSGDVVVSRRVVRARPPTPPAGVRQDDGEHRDGQGRLSTALTAMLCDEGTPELRPRACANVRALCDADMAVLLEPVEGALTSTASCDRSGAGPVGRWSVRLDAADRPAVLTASAAALGAAQVCAHDLVHDGRTYGLLVVLWETAGHRVHDEELAHAAQSLAAALAHDLVLNELRREATTDPLTGALNRRGLVRRAAALLTRAAGDPVPTSLVLLDLDDFKQVNDLQGHEAGDRVLVDAARAWATSLRPLDVLARLGGDEFVVLLPATAHDQAEEVARRLVQACPAPVTVSAGTATSTAGSDLQALLREADADLYRAKRSRGR